MYILVCIIDLIHCVRTSVASLNAGPARRVGDLELTVFELTCHR